MKRFPSYIVASALSLVLTSGAQPAANIDPQAERVLRNACQYLAQAPFFSLTAEIWREHVDSAGEKIQFSRSMDLEVKRPDRLHAEIQSPHTQRGFWYDGRALTILDRKRNLFSTAPMPSALDEALDAAHDKFGVDFPMMDLAISDPFSNAMARVVSAKYFGIAQAMGYQCHHLAFTQDNIDWQVWIESGPRPLIRKFVITHKNETGSPQFTALIRQWDMTERIADSDFVFEQPGGALKVEMLQVSPSNTGESTVPKPTGFNQPRRN